MKPKTFRPTEKALAKIKQYSNRKRVNDSLAINQILEAWEAQELEAPPFFYCPYELEQWAKREQISERCHTCNFKRYCPAWIGKIRELPTTL